MQTGHDGEPKQTNVDEYQHGQGKPERNGIARSEDVTCRILCQSILPQFTQSWGKFYSPK